MGTEYECGAQLILGKTSNVKFCFAGDINIFRMAETLYTLTVEYE